MPLSYMDRYISIKQILDDVLDHPLLKDVSFERAVNHTVHFIRIVGCPRIFNEKTELIEIKDHRGLLPCDYNSVIQVRKTGSCDHEHDVFRYSTDSFHMSKDKHASVDLTYKIQGNVIFTSIREGTIEVAYEALAIDSEGYPLIPDNSNFIRALELYIKKQHFTVLFDLGKIPPAVYNNTLQEYAWAVGAAQSDLVRPSIDQMESLTNMLNTLLPRVTEHNSAFSTAGSRELWKIK